MRTTWVELLRRLAPLLSADLFDRLRVSPYPATLSADEEEVFGKDLLQTIHILSSLYHTLTNFLPRYLLDLAPTPGQPHGELLEGSFIFADVTGFTALTGELSKQGTEGQEEMNRLMNSLFAALLDPLLTSGGDLLAFGGDAALAYFPARPNQPKGQDARWAARTALRLVEAIAEFAHFETPYGTFSLTMSAGIERGRAFAAVVGTSRRMELLVSGGPIQGAMAAEGHAGPGQVFAGPAMRPFLDSEQFLLQQGIVEAIHGGKMDDYEAIPPVRRRGRRLTIFSHRIPDLLDHVASITRQIETIAPFISPHLLVLLTREDDIRRHSPVAIQFVNIEGLEDMALGPIGPEQATAVLQRFFVQAQEIVSERGGIINKLDPYARGCFLLNAFGMPIHQEGAVCLAASTALELTRALERVNREFDLTPPLIQRTGSTYDRIFTGEFGYRHRREWVVAGPAVNMAARLMSKAEPNQIVLDPLAWGAIEEDFVATALPPVPLKGIARPVPRFSLQGKRTGYRQYSTDHPFVNRLEELRSLEQRLEEAAAGRGSALTLIGDAGIGKGRLAAALANSARRQGMAVLVGHCRPFAKITPYHPWTHIIGQWLESDELGQVETGEDRAKGALVPAEDPLQRLRDKLGQFGLLSFLPAFVDLLGLAPTSWRTSPAQTRRSSTDSDEPSSDLFATLQRKTGRLTAEPLECRQPTGAGWPALVERTAGAETAQVESGDVSIWQTLRERFSISKGLHLALERQARHQATLVILTDLQWMDPTSRELLEAVAVAAPEWPLLLLTTARSERDCVDDRLSITALSNADSQSLAAGALRAARLDREVVDWLLPRTGGNPLFILSYCRALKDISAVVTDATSGEARWAGPPPELPLTLQEILLAQVDRLSQEAREAVQRAAVIGTTFPNWLLTQIVKDTLSPTQLEDALGQAAHTNMIIPSPPDQAYTFSSQALHETIYTTLSHASRWAWHEEVGDHLERTGETTSYGRLEQIAYHYSHSKNHCKAAHFSRLAGAKALAQWADKDALIFYEQALAAASECDDEGIAEQRLAYEGIGDLCGLQGRGTEAIAAYEAALRESPPEYGHRLRAKLALTAPLGGRVDPSSLEELGACLASSDPIRPWLGALQVRLQAEHGKTQTATTLCRELLRTASGTLVEMLRASLDSLESDTPLPPYADFYALFAHACLRPPPLTSLDRQEESGNQGTQRTAD